jgi:hypothetical protein
MAEHFAGRNTVEETVSSKEKEILIMERSSEDIEEESANVKYNFNRFNAWRY